MSRSADFSGSLRSLHGYNESRVAKQRPVVLGAGQAAQGFCRGASAGSVRSSVSSSRGRVEELSIVGHGEAAVQWCVLRTGM